MIKIKINNEICIYNENISLLEISKEFKDNFKYPIILAKVDGVYKELNETISKDCEIEFYDLKNKFANNVYINGLVFLLTCAYNKIFKDEDIIVRHSLDKGLYIETTNEINEEDIINIKNKMFALRDNNLNITRITVSRIDAIDYFKMINYNVKADLMKYSTSNYITLYKLDNKYDYFYSLMPINTGSLKDFDLTYLNNKGFILSYPTIYSDDIPPFVFRKNVFNLFKDSRNWAKQLNLVNVVDLNKLVENGKISEVIRMDELMLNYRLMTLAKEIIDKKEAKVILLSGPSSTGKTTTTNKLTLCLKSLGKKTMMLSMDDFFKERSETPLDSEGNFDFESFETVDIELFNKTVNSLINKEEVSLPTFNFILGKKEYNNITKIDDDTILLVEGIHALNPKVLDNIAKNKKVKVYLSALNELGIDNHSRISTTENRLLRRIVRDNRLRGFNVLDTLETWKNVRKGEELNIFPYQDEADYSLNTAMIYELGVLKTFVEPLLYSVPLTNSYYNEAIKLLNFLKVFLPVPTEDIPKDSIIREFIGGGCFKV